MPTPPSPPDHLAGFLGLPKPRLTAPMRRAFPLLVQALADSVPHTSTPLYSLNHPAYAGLCGTQGDRQALQRLLTWLAHEWESQMRADASAQSRPRSVFTSTNNPQVPPPSPGAGLPVPPTPDPQVDPSPA